MLSEIKTHYRRGLPHIHPPGTVLFVTFRLAGSLPTEVVAALRAERLQAEQAALDGDYSALLTVRKHYFKRWDQALDRAEAGPHWLTVAGVTAVVKAELHQLEAQGYYFLLGYCIMSNHVHLLAQTPDPLKQPFHATLQLLKGRTARVGNAFLQRRGAFWQSESYDHAARDSSEVSRILNYIVNNPVKASLVTDWQHWPHTYAHPDAW